MDAHYVISEDAENALYAVDEALSCLAALAVQIGDDQVELRGAELAALLGLVRRQLHEARVEARFVTRHTAPPSPL
jgi:hypothetical protein